MIVCPVNGKNLVHHRFRDEIPNADGSKWLAEYNPQEDSELAKTANELLGTVDDPKFSETEVKKT